MPFPRLRTSPSRQTGTMTAWAFVVINEQWRGYGVGRALIDDARAHHDEIRLVARGKSIGFYRVLGFTEIPWDDIAPGVTEECGGCPLIEECGPLPMGWKREGA